MNNLDRIKLALEFIEQHLTESIQLKDIASTVNFSEYHFHRMFRALTGYPLKGYLRRRRLYLAALDIINDIDSLANIAQRYQFSSQSSFTVAFKQMHGITPGDMRRRDDCKKFGRMALNDIELKRPNGLLKEPTLVDLQSFTVVGLDCDVKYSQLLKEDNPINQLWNKARNQYPLIDKKPLYAVYHYDPSELHLEDILFTYMVGFAYEGEDVLAKEFIQKKIPESSYLLFHVNLENISLFDIYDYIDEQWIPQSDYILSEKPDFEIHHKTETSSLVDIYISIEE